MKRYNFASDNTSGMCPEALYVLNQANVGRHPSYGEDEWTTESSNALRDLFECDGEVFFVCTGTAANSLALGSLSTSYQSVICHELAHVETHECGAPEFFSNGAKLLTVPGPHGKLTPEGVERRVRLRTDIHYPPPHVLSVSQSTEAGTVYTVDELQTLCTRAKNLGLKVHMDGARFFNACVALNKTPAELSHGCGVDVLCLSGTKNGLGMGEAVIFFNRNLAEGFAYRCKQAGQLVSKMRFVSAPWLGVLRDRVWERNASHANAMARRLRSGLSGIPDVEFSEITDANGVFVYLPERAIRHLRQEGWIFYTFIGSGFARFMCAWDTRPEEVDELITAVRQAVTE
ncbi:MAG: low specificity L-threonine aldolase [Kiritimatiellae bacterium]|jgi:threonine aldolase|nr:low specificity L-threonine aldolase [Kiritimatiellia bacterium]